MLAFALRRILYSIPVLIVASFLIFALGSASADPLAPLRAKNPPAPQNVLDAETVRLHLDQPLLQRYFGWLGGIFTGDFGPSVVSTAQIGPDLADRFLVTIRLIALAMLIA